MEWWLALLIILGSLFVLFALGIPVAFAFLAVDILGAIIFFGGTAGLLQLIDSIRGSVATFTLLPLVLFLLMGSILFYSGIAFNTIDAVDKWLGHVPGRLGLIAIAAGVLLATLTGSNMASTAILGGALTPEMERRGYKKVMSLGPIMAAGGLAMMIPPSGLAVLVAALGEASIGGVLMGIIIPGLMMAFVYVFYTIIRCWLQPSLAPPYKTEPTTLSTKIMLTAKYVLPIGVVIFLVTGVIFLGVATPSEAAATGALGSFLLAACYGNLNWQSLKKIMIETASLSFMILLIITGAITFGQILAFSGASIGLAKLLSSLPVPPIMVVVAMLLALLILGTAAEEVSLVVVTIPLFMPIVRALGLDPVWFCVLMLLNIEMGMISPPYGSILFVMQGVAPSGTTAGDIYRAALPYFFLDCVVMAVMLAFPITVLWLPSMMR